LTINNSDKCGAVLGHELFDPHQTGAVDYADGSQMLIDPIDWS